jgi:hypothetical protein
MESALLSATKGERLATTEAARPSFLRTVAPGVAGFVAIGLLSHGVDSALGASGLFPSLGVPMASRLFVLATVYRSVIGVLGCYIAAHFAAGRPMRSALTLGCIGFALSTLGIFATWQKPELGPLWYPAALALLTLPSAWLGGKLGTSAHL